jgi:acylphosphatase
VPAITTTHAVAPKHDQLRTIVRLTGRVQGVGFRYHVAHVAARFAIAGTVRNLRSSQALEIDCEGAAAEVERFLQAVIAQPPPLGKIDAVEREEAAPRGLDSFAIGATGD